MSPTISLLKIKPVLHSRFYHWIEIEYIKRTFGVLNSELFGVLAWHDKHVSGHDDVGEFSSLGGKWHTSL